MFVGMNKIISLYLYVYNKVWVSNVMYQNCSKINGPVLGSIALVLVLLAYKSPLILSIRHSQLS